MVIKIKKKMSITVDMDVYSMLTKTAVNNNTSVSAIANSRLRAAFNNAEIFWSWQYRIFTRKREQAKKELIFLRNPELLDGGEHETK